MIISQTPLRVSFLGGGTDYPAYFREHGGAALATALASSTYVTVRRTTRFEDYAYRIFYSRVEAVQNIDEIQHPSARECLRFLDVGPDVEIHYISDLPARTGLGSSSSATVGLLHALHAFKGEPVSREQLAREAVHVEQEMIRERVGCQDQYTCALGGFLHLEFHHDGTVRPNVVTLPEERLRALQDRLMLMYTGIRRHAHEVVEEQLAKTQAGDNLRELDQLKQLVKDGLDILAGSADLAEFGALLHDGWMLKRQLSSRISNADIDGAYERARRAGALGGKLLGAGAGGFLLLYVEPEHRDRVRRALPTLRETELSFDNLGSRIIFFRP